MLALAGFLAMALPPQAPARRIPYRELLGSIWTLLFTEPVLRRHALVGAAGMGAFSAFWTTLTFHLANLPAHYGSETAGLFGLVGAAGAVAAAGAGRIADRVGPRPLNGAALLLIVLSFGLMGVSGHSLVVLSVGVILMDAGVQASHISNQTRIYALSADMRNRLNGIYMVIYFLGGATGSALGSRAWELFGWSGVCAVGAGNWASPDWECCLRSGATGLPPSKGRLLSREAEMPHFSGPSHVLRKKRTAPLPPG